jgi:hypothetical protein
MITFVLAAAVLIGALCVAVALDGATTEAPPGVVHVLAAGCSRHRSCPFAPEAMSPARSGLDCPRLTWPVPGRRE